MSATVASDDAPARLSRWSGIVPAVRWLRDYKPAWFRADLAEAGADLFNRTCFNYPTLGDLYKYATYAAMLKRDGLVVDDSGQLPTRTVS